MDDVDFGCIPRHDDNLVTQSEASLLEDIVAQCEAVRNRPASVGKYSRCPIGHVVATVPRRDLPCRGGMIITDVGVVYKSLSSHVISWYDVTRHDVP